MVKTMCTGILDIFGVLFLNQVIDFRVGRTARAGRAGRSVAFVTQYDVEAYQRLEGLIGQKLPEVVCCRVFDIMLTYVVSSR